MRSRHQVVEIDPIFQADDVSPTERNPVSAGASHNDSVAVLFDDATDPEDDSPLLIDETHAPIPFLRDAMGASAPATRSTVSAIPSSQPITTQRPTLSWGLGTDGWPRHNSRLVRLLVCDPEILLAGIAGGTWGALSLANDVRSTDGERWPLAISGSLQMPYPSPPLDVEVRAQPFHDRYSRVDVVLCSHHRWPRRYFDVASRCVTQMQRLERSPIGC